MKDDTSDERRRVRLPRHLPRLALTAGLALIVLTLGLVVTPGNPPEPPPPTQSDRVRSAALADALDLRSAVERLAAAGSPAGAQAAADPARTVLDGTVSLLTTQARALLRPGQAAPAATAEPSSTASATPTAAAPASAAGTAVPATAAGLAAGLANSGRQRLADAAEADGGTARLLAVIGTGQLLQAASLAAAAGAPDPSTTPPDAATAPATASPAPTACPDGTPPPSSGADLPNALAAVTTAERETVYGYQVALPRLDGPGATTAAAQLARHEGLAAAAEAQARQHCALVPPREAGYALDPSFLASPGPGLAALESGSLAAYADLVALSDGSTRQWAVSGLLGAARRAVLWGAKPGPVPGLPDDPAAFPTLPAG